MIVKNLPLSIFLMSPEMQKDQPDDMCVVVIQAKLKKEEAADHLPPLLYKRGGHFYMK
ncbi:hypothetical protein RCO48_19405 [Peribacillus frigoritolerans]|nr:hypothetical protein [Peribacillus frigoritolerans]